MPTKTTTATKSVVYSGGLDAVTLHFLSGHVLDAGLLRLQELGVIRRDGDLAELCRFGEHR